MDAPAAPATPSWLEQDFGGWQPPRAMPAARAHGAAARSAAAT